MGAANTSSDSQCGYGRRIGVEVPIRRGASFDYDGALVTPQPATVVLLASGRGVLGLCMLRRRTARRAA